MLLLAAALLAAWLPFESRFTPPGSGLKRIESQDQDRLLTFQEYPSEPGEPNRFLAQNGSFSALLEPRRVLVRITDRSGHPHSLQMHLVGSDQNARSEGRRLPGRVHYLVGNDPARWRTGLSRYERIVFRAVYPGVDLHYYGTEDQLEYDLVLQPGANPEQVILRFEGVDGLSINSRGGLTLEVGAERLELLSPVVYQEEDRVRTLVPASYQVREDQTVQFRVGEYDRDRDLVIDPVLVYSTILGGIGSERNALIAVDNDGNAYVADRTESGNFPLVNPFNDEFSRFPQGYITKFDPSGNVIFSTYLGGTNNERLQDIALDRDGNIYVTGHTGSDDYPVQNAFQDALSNGPPNATDAFVSKLAPTGDSFVFSTYLGGFRREHLFDDVQVGAITTDAEGNCYVTGVTESSNFPLLNPFQSEANSPSARNPDAFVAKFDATGGLVYSSYLGGSLAEMPSDIAVDSAGNVYVVGGTDSPDFPLQNPLRDTPGGTCQSEGLGDPVTCEGFVAKVSPSGDSLVYSTYLGGLGDFEFVGGVVAEADGTIHLVGHTSSEDFPSIPSPAGHGAFTRSTLAGETDLFLASLAPDGSVLTYAAFLGGGGAELSGRLSIADNGDWCFSGATGSPEFPVYLPLQGALNGPQDGVIACFNPTTATVRHSTFIGSVVVDFAQDIAVHGTDVYASGTSNGAQTFPQLNSLMLHGGRLDAFVTRITSAPGPLLGSVPDQSWTRFVLSDTNQNGRPDPRDEVLTVSRRGNQVDLASGRWGQAVLEFSDTNSSGQFDTVESTRFKLRNGEVVASSTFRAHSYGEGTGGRATSVSLTEERLRRRPGIRQGQASLIDSDGDGIVDAIRGQGDGYPEVTVSLQRIDINGDGNADFVSIPWSLSQLAGVNLGDLTANPQIFLPLGDTDGDGIPDSIAPDFDNNNIADPDFPQLARMAGPGQAALHSLHFAQFGEGGGLLFSQIILFSLDLEGEAPVTIVLRDDEGNALQTDLNGEVVNGQLQATIPAGGLRTFSTDGAGPVVGGSVTVNSDRPIAGVGSSPELGLGFLAPMESRLASQIQTGVAIKNLESEQITLVLRLLDANGLELATRQLALAPFGHHASFIDQLFGQLDLSDFAGVLRVETARRITATVLQSRPGEFATMPVTALRGGSPTLQFAHFGEEAELLFSQFLIVRMNEQDEGTARLRMLDDQGAALTYDLNGAEFTGSTDPFTVSPQGLTILSTDGEGPLISGSATLVSGFGESGRFAGVLLFGGVVGLAGVGSSPEFFEGFVAPMETDLANNVNTGVAIRNLNDGFAAILEFGLYDADGKLLAQDDAKKLSSQGHLALFVDQFEWVPEDGVALDFSRFQGTIRVTSNLSLAATVIQTRPGQFATMPVSVLAE